LFIAKCIVQKLSLTSSAGESSFRFFGGWDKNSSYGTVLLLMSRKSIYVKRPRLPRDALIEPINHYACVTFFLNEFAFCGFSFLQWYEKQIFKHLAGL